jgi:hypothetical protein
VLSSMPIRDLGEMLFDGDALHAARSLRYRDFITVGLIVNDTHVFDDNWIYIHELQVVVA